MVLCREARLFISPGLAADGVSGKRGDLDGAMATAQKLRLSSRGLLWPPLCPEASSAPGWSALLGHCDFGVPMETVVTED